MSVRKKKNSLEKKFREYEYLVMPRHSLVKGSWLLAKVPVVTSSFILLTA